MKRRFSKNIGFKRTLTLYAVIGIAVGVLFFITRKDNLSIDKDKVIVKEQKINSRINALYKEASGYLKKGDDAGAVTVYEKIVDQFTDSKESDKALFFLAEHNRSNGDLAKAKELYTELIENCPSSELLQDSQKNLWAVNVDLIFFPIETSDSFVYTVVKGDTLGKLAKHFNTTVDLIKKSNGLKSDLIRIGKKLKITKLKFSLVVDKSENILILRGNGSVIKVYHVSTGLNNSTPEGTFTITTKLEDPTWYSAQAVIPSDSPENILGSRWMGLSKKGYGIHGTTDPEAIGKQVTAGCVRMRNDEVEELYSILPRGTEVTIVE